MWINLKAVLAILMLLISTDLTAWHFSAEFLILVLGAGYLFVAFYFTALLINTLPTSESIARFAAYAIIFIAFGWMFLEIYFGVTFQESKPREIAFSYLACVFISIGTALVLAHLFSQRVWCGVLVLLWLICLPATMLLGVSEREPAGLYTYPVISPVRDILLYGLMIAAFLSAGLWFVSLLSIVWFLIKKDLLRVSISVSASFLLFRSIGWGMSVIVFEPYK